MEDLGSDMEQEGRQPLNWAEEAEKEERLREHTQADNITIPKWDFLNIDIKILKNKNDCNSVK